MSFPRGNLPTPHIFRPKVSHLAPASYSALITTPIACDSPGARVTPNSRTLHVSIHNIAVHSSSPKSVNAFALSIHGFQTTVVFELDFSTTNRRCQPGSRTTHVDCVFK